MEQWERAHPTPAEEQRRHFDPIEREQTYEYGKPYWSFPQHNISLQDLADTNKFLNASDDVLRRLDRSMGARLPNANDPGSIEDSNRFSYLESSVLPS
jgi:hypothetical protein